MIHALILAVLTTTPSCWDIFDGALRHSASAAHPPYVTYSERIDVTANREPLIFSLARVDYRDDGVSRVEDERFNYEPFVTRHAEPGPPELGPYGKRRAMWQLDADDNLPTIAHVRSGGNVGCMAAEEPYKGHDTYHLAFTGGLPGRPGLKALWVDAQSSEIWKLIISAPVTFIEDPKHPNGLAEFQVELAYIGPYLVVQHVVWTYRRQEYAQWVDYFGEYTYSDYAFPSELPASYFGGDIAALP